MKIQIEFPEPDITMKLSRNELLEMRDIYRHYSMYHKKEISESAVAMSKMLDAECLKLLNR